MDADDLRWSVRRDGYRRVYVARAGPQESYRIGRAWVWWGRSRAFRYLLEVAVGGAGWQEYESYERLWEAKAAALTEARAQRIGRPA